MTRSRLITLVFSALASANVLTAQPTQPGHYGIFSGTAWRTAIYPQIRELIHRYQSREAAESGDECRQAEAA